MMASSPRTYGYDAMFEPPLKKRLECPICLLGQKDPLQTPCGHRFCANCIDNALRMTGPRCPIDNKPLSIAQLFPDNFARREVLSLTVLCNNSKPGCGWKGELRELEDHLTLCQLEEIQCPFGCGSKFTRGDFSTHQSECEKKPSRCSQCDITYPNDLIEEHQPFCSRTKPQAFIRQILGQHKLLRWTGYLQLHGHSTSTFQAHFISLDSQEINTSFWPCNLKFTIQTGSKECDQTLDLGKKMNQIMKVDFITETNQNMENFFVEKMFYVCRISNSKRKKNDLILQLMWSTEKKECVVCAFKDVHIKYLTKKMENRNIAGMAGMFRTPSINHSAPGQVWPPPVAGISVNSTLPRINVTPDILLSQAPSLPSGLPQGNPPVITQPVWSPFVVYPSLLSAYVGTPNILTYSQLNTSPINFPSAYMDTASYFIIDGQNSSPTSIMHTHTNPVEPVEDLFNIHEDELAENAEAVWLLNNLNESPERLENQFGSSGSGRIRTRRSTSSRVEPYAIPERFQGGRAAYPLPHLSDTNSGHISIPLQTVVPSVSAAVVYPNSLNLPQQLVPGGVPPPVPSIIFTSLENATSNIIGNANLAVTDPDPHPHQQPVSAQGPAEYPSVAVVQGELTTAMTEPTPHVPAILPANTLIPPLSVHNEPIHNRTIWDQGFMPIHISSSQNQN